MELIINTIMEDIETLAMMIGCLAVLEVLNIILGSVMAAACNTFDWNKLWKGIVKAILVAIVMCVYCAVLEVLPLIFERAGISMPSDMITFIQVITIVAVALKKYAKGIYDKLLVLLDVTENEIDDFDAEAIEQRA